MSAQSRGGAGGGGGLIISKAVLSLAFNAVLVSGRVAVMRAGGRAASCINEQQGRR